MFKKKGFTIFEIVVTISVMLLILGVIKNSIKLKDAHIYQGQSCLNDIYAKISQDFLMAGLTSKGFNSGGNIFYPSSYYININSITNEINVRNDIKTGLTNVISGCRVNNTHSIFITGGVLTGIIEKSQNNNKFSFINLSGDPIITGVINIFLLNKLTNTGEEIGKFNIDIRSQTFTKSTCLSFSGVLCKQWSQ